jgi:hypothetical protein
MARGTKVMPLERQIHLGVVQLLKLNAAPGLVWFHVANERRTTEREGAFLKCMGVRAGVADFCLYIPRLVEEEIVANNIALPYKTIYRHEVTIPAFLEIKRPGGRLSASQEQFRDDVTAIGCLWGLAYSTDAAAKLLKSWGALRSTPTSMGKEAA